MGYDRGKRVGENVPSGQGQEGVFLASRTALHVLLIDPRHQSEEEIIAQARECQQVLSEQLSRSASSSSSSPLLSPTHHLDPEVIHRAKCIMPSLVAIIQASSDPSKMEELLSLNDSLTSLLEETGWSRLQNGGPMNGSSTYEGSMLSNSSLDTSRSPSPQASQPAKDVSPKIPSATPALSIQTDVSVHDSDVEDGELSTPKVDKGKGRAEPEPEQPEKILSPTPSFLIATSDDEDEDAGKARYVEVSDEGATLGSPSPTDL